MYKYVTDKKLIGKMKKKGANLVNQLKMVVNNDWYLDIHFELVGSAARNLITQNGKLQPDLDYNLFIDAMDEDENWNDGQQTKEYLKKELNKILKKNGLKPCKDSTSVISIKDIPLEDGSSFSIDIAIVREDDEDENRIQRLIHKKTGKTQNDHWCWNKGIDYNEILDKADELKVNDKWLDVRDMYLKRKNYYLEKQDITHPSFVVFIETINNIYNTMKQNQRNSTSNYGMFRHDLRLILEGRAREMQPLLSKL